MCDIPGHPAPAETIVRECDSMNKAAEFPSWRSSNYPVHSTYGHYLLSIRRVAREAVQIDGDALRRSYAEVTRSKWADPTEIS